MLSLNDPCRLALSSLEYIPTALYRPSAVSNLGVPGCPTSVLLSALDGNHKPRTIGSRCRQSVLSRKKLSFFSTKMATNSFRDSMSSLGWSRRDPEPVTTNSSTPFLSTLQSYNPFSSGGYVSLPTHNGEAPGAPLPAPSRREEEEAFFARKSIAF